MSNINFNSVLEEINSMLLIRIPLSTSEKLPSRGMVMVEGTINRAPFQAALEPDGMGSHWFNVNGSLCQAANISIGASVDLAIEPIKIWPEPEVPDDLMSALIASNLLEFWDFLTSKAHWDWIRWIRSTNNPQTRQKRIEVTCSKLSSNKKNPCCFDRSRCSVMAVSKNGVLI